MNTGARRCCCEPRFLVDVESYTKIQGQPLFAAEIQTQIEERVEPTGADSIASSPGGESAGRFER